MLMLCMLIGLFPSTASALSLGSPGGSTITISDSWKLNDGTKVAASQHTYCTAISWADALPGDLVFYPDDTHVGIVAGWDENGNILIVHCASGYNNVVITGKEGFASIGSPLFFAE